MVVGRHMENLFLNTYAALKNWTAKVIRMILRVRHKIRPGRSFPRRSFKPGRKWAKKGVKSSAAY